METLPMLLRPDLGSLELPKKPVRVLGIDLGTTNSTAAEIIWDPQSGTSSAARCLEVEQQTSEGVYTHVLVPSVVAIHGNRVIIGEGAKRLRARAAEIDLSQNKNLFYECKNDIGIQKTYHRAPEGFRSAAEIGGKVIKFLYDAALTDEPTPISRTVITVPASFQAVQRHDTMRAAELAGLDVKGGDLLDEPVAAFLDYLISHYQEIVPEIRQPKKLVVFDFGGGTCDVAVFQVRLARASDPLLIEPLSVSRYHRLGGGDIDAAILYEVLLPQICSQNNLSILDLSYEDKKRYIEPAYLSMAEALKIGLSTEISRLIRFDAYDGADKGQVASKQPGTHPCQLKDQSLSLQSPTLTASDFEKLLEPFLDRDLLFARETDYRTTCSIFAPLQDALDRSNLSPDQVDFCLLVGGSNLIPQVVRAIQGFMGKARILTYPDQDSIQTAVARGAAYHALCLAVYGKSLLQPICHDRIAIRTAAGLMELIPEGVSLPFPATGGYAKLSLAVPETSLIQDLELRVEVVAGEEERLLFGGLWRIAAPVNRGDPLWLEFKYDKNQVLDFKMTMAGESNAWPFSMMLEHPFTNAVNPWAEKIEIEKLEESLRTGKIPRDQIPDKFVELSDKYADLGHREKALEYLKRALRTKNRPDVNILNRMGSLYGELGDQEREEKSYREAALSSPWSGVWFNLALAQRRQGRFVEAMESLDMALSKEKRAPYLVLRALLAEDLKKTEERQAYLEKALGSFGAISFLDDWQLGWYLTAATKADEQQLIKDIETERKRRLVEKGTSAPPGGHLPIPTSNIQKAEA